MAQQQRLTTYKRIFVLKTLVFRFEESDSVNNKS